MDVIIQKMDGREPTLRRCDLCVHFEERTGSTGSCLYHHMYVLKNHECLKFAQQHKGEGCI